MIFLYIYKFLIITFFRVQISLVSIYQFKKWILSKKMFYKNVHMNSIEKCVKWTSLFLWTRMKILLLLPSLQLIYFKHQSFFCSKVYYELNKWKLNWPKPCFLMQPLRTDRWNKQTKRNISSKHINVNLTLDSRIHSWKPLWHTTTKRRRNITGVTEHLEPLIYISSNFYM